MLARPSIIAFWLFCTPAAAQQQPASCETFRLDQLPGNPFNPDQPRDPSERHAFVPPTYQSVQSFGLRFRDDAVENQYRSSEDNENCAFQTLASLLNYQASMANGLPHFSADFLTARNCRHLVAYGDPALRFPQAVNSFNSSGSCSAPGFAEGLALVQETALFQT